MSSSTPAEASVPKEKKGVGKFIARWKTVLKKGEAAATSRRFSILGSSKGKQPETTTVQEPVTAPPAKGPADQEGVIRVTRAQLFEERAKQLGERFGLKIEPNDWHKTEGEALRVEKPIRMRVRRTCHKCDATFGVAKECPNCGHARCTKCVRHPPKRTEEEKQASRERWAARQLAEKENPPLVADWRPYDEKDIVLKRPPRQVGGNEVIFRKPRQRVRRTCHECSTLFTSGNKRCENCEHVRCTDCPRDP